ncbi:MAG: hypothetical protein GXO00_01335 [Candidatus Diapherotrites archaeon]|nr:hypothetical protein [Candidatus Diapherotrites archaeon]
MKGQFFAPLVGVVLFLLAVGFAVYIVQSERSYVSLLGGFSDKLRFITYGEVSLFDVKTSLEAYVRNKTYDYLEKGESIDVEKIFKELENKLPRWVNSFLEEVEKNVEGVNVYYKKRPQVTGISGRQIYAEYINYSLGGESGTLVVEIGNVRSEIQIPASTSVLLPFPVREVEEVKDVLKDLEERVNNIEEVSFDDDDFVKWEELEKINRELIELGKGLYGYKIDKSVKSTSYCEFSFTSMGCQEEGSLYTGLDTLTVTKIFSWRIPGTGRSVSISLTTTKTFNKSFIPEDISYIVKVDGFAVGFESDEKPDSKKIISKLKKICGCEEQYDNEDDQYRWECRKSHPVCNELKDRLNRE